MVAAKLKSLSEVAQRESLLHPPHVLGLYKFFLLQTVDTQNAWLTYDAWVDYETPAAVILERGFQSGKSEQRIEQSLAS